MATKKRKKKQTLSEFKAWLDGVVELQDQDWHPNETQWKQIRDRISGIVDTPVSSVAEHSGTPNNAGHQVQPYQNKIPGIVPSPPTGGIPRGSIMTTPAAANELGIGNEDDVTDINSPSVFI